MAARGFTLVETLVAITVLALMFGALMPVFHNGLAVLTRGDRHLRAVQIAQSLLDAQTLDPVPGADAPAAAAAGEQGDFAWSVQREAYAADDGAPVPEVDAALVLVRVSATVSWPGNASGVRLSTLAVEPAR